MEMLTIPQLISAADTLSLKGFVDFLSERKNARLVVIRLEACGYRRLSNPDEDKGALVHRRNRRFCAAQHDRSPGFYGRSSLSATIKITGLTGLFPYYHPAPLSRACLFAALWLMEPIGCLLRG
jgi:hypothetical protein